MEEKGLRVHAGKTKIMICGIGLDLLQSSGEFPCAFCCTGVGSNSIFCNGCKHWVHKKCSRLKCLTKDPDYKCIPCQGTARLLDGRPQREVVASFSYLRDMLSAAGGFQPQDVWKLPGRSSRSCCQFSLPATSLSIHVVREELLCVECNAPCQWDLAIDKAKPPTAAAEWKGNDQTNQQCQAARHCHHQIQWATCAVWHWWSGPHSEGEKAPLVRTCETLQWCSQSLWHTGWWNAWAWRPKMTWKQLTERDCREWKL